MKALLIWSPVSMENPMIGMNKVIDIPSLKPLLKLPQLGTGDLWLFERVAKKQVRQWGGGYRVSIDDVDAVYRSLNEPADRDEARSWFSVLEPEEIAAAS